MRFTNLATKVFRFFFPKDFIGELKRGMGIGTARVERAEKTRRSRKSK